MLPFDTDNPEFARGVELGIIYAELWMLPPPSTRYERLIHTSNLEMMIRVAEQQGWSLKVEAIGEGAELDEWTKITMDRLQIPRAEGELE